MSNVNASDKPSAQDTTDPRAADPPRSVDFSNYHSDDIREVRRDIALITHFLNGYRHGKSGSVSAASQSSTLHFWSLLSFVLDTGHFRIAVTGQMSDNKVHSAVFVRSASDFAPGLKRRDDADVPDPRRAESEQVKVVVVESEGKERGLKLLRECEKVETVQDNETHIRDIVTIMDAIIVPPSHPRLPLETIMGLVLDMFAFVLRRTYVRLCARLVDRYKIWTACPIGLLLASEHEPVIHTTVTLTTTPNLRALLHQHGIERDSNTTNNGQDKKGSTELYRVRSSNVKGWLGTFADVLASMEKHLTIHDGEELTGKKEPPADVYELCYTITSLDALVNSKVLDIIIDATFDKLLDTKYREGKKREIQVARARGPTPSRAAADKTDEAAELEADDDKEYNEDSPQHLIRYLKTLTMAYTTVKTLVHRACSGKVPGSSLDMHIFKLKPLPTNTHDSNFVTRFTEDFVNILPVKSNHRAGVNDFFRSTNVDAHKVRGTPVHAEASLMGLACANTSNAALQGNLLANVFPSDPNATIPIGLSNKCCFCCHMLARLLTERIPANAQTYYPEFALPGTHATIFPWMAPSVGIPLDVLKEMRKRLLEVLYLVLTSPKRRTESDQTSDSPASSLEDFPEISEESAFFDLEKHRRQRDARSMFLSDFKIWIDNSLEVWG